jgi:uncharacterized metal-binding protein YceD (DUF177 family)
MQVDVSDILRQGEGSQLDFTVEGESPRLDNVALVSPVSGRFRAMGTKEGVIISGRLQADISLECHRCLRAFTHSLAFPLEAEFQDEPEEDQFPIDKYGKIDLAEPVRQEIEVHLPLQQLCQADCNGIKLKQKKDIDGSS